MSCLSKGKFITYIVAFSICLELLVPLTFSLSLEETISRRLSTRSYTPENLSVQELLKVLWAAYGYTNGHRNILQIGYSYSLVLFPVNETGSYRYIPESNSLVVHNLSVNKETIRPRFPQSYPSDASVVLVVAWNQTKMNNGYFASAEAGCLVQNVYLAAATLDVGTCCVGWINSEGLRNDLQLPNTIIPLLVMPLGYPKSPYPPASPDYYHMIGNLPPVQYSSLSFEEAVRNMFIARTWAAEDLSVQGLSQLLWASYGYANTSHRTTPSANGIYPLVIYVSNATGVYEYIPKEHSIMETLHGDKRWDIANVCSGQVWAAEAPAIFLIAYNSSYNGGNTGDGGTLPHEWMEVNAGTVIQELLLEASAWNLSANIVSDGLEEWNGTGAEGLRNVLGLLPSLVPLYIVPVGHKISYSLNLHVKAWDLSEDIQGAYVYADSEWKMSDENGWANWTDASGTIEVKVKWFEFWVNGTFIITMDEDKTIDVRCNIFDTFITCVEEKQMAFLQFANVTVFTGGSRIVSGTTGSDGTTRLANVPNSTLTFVVYDGNNNLIANRTVTITSEGQQETIVCNKNYETSQMVWEITEVLVHSAFTILPLTPILFIAFRVAQLKQRIKTMSCNRPKKQDGGERDHR